MPVPPLLLVVPPLLDVVPPLLDVVPPELLVVPEHWLVQFDSRHCANEFSADVQLLSWSLLAQFCWAVAF